MEDNLEMKKFIDWIQSLNASFYFKKLKEEGIADSALIKLLDFAVNPDSKSVFKCILPKDTELYRARIVKADEYKKELGLQVDQNGSIQGFNRQNSAEAPLGAPKAGRNNIKGTSYLYLAETIQTACAEVRPNHSIVSVARFMPKRDLSLIDFSTDVSIPHEFSNDLQVALPVFFTKLMDAFRIPALGEEDYALTQTIADYVRKTGCDGIKYRSSLTDEPCYTIFNSHHSIIEFMDSTLFLPIATTSKYVEINTGKTATADFSIPDELIPQIINEVRKRIKELLDKERYHG